jgi:hypothetical protein
MLCVSNSTGARLKAVAGNLFPNPRWKTYSAQSGYVYRYIFEGLDPQGYGFRAVSGPAIEMLIRIELDGALVGRWVEENRELNEIEKFGIAKMALLRALDDLGEPATGLIRVQPEAADIASICRELEFVE